MFAFFSFADPEIITNRAADIFFALFPAIPFSFTGPINLAGFAAIHFGIRHDIFLLLSIKIHHMSLIVNKIVV